MRQRFETQSMQQEDPDGLRFITIRVVIAKDVYLSATVTNRSSFADVREEIRNKHGIRLSRRFCTEDGAIVYEDSQGVSLCPGALCLHYK